MKQKFKRQRYGGPVYKSKNSIYLYIIKVDNEYVCRVGVLVCGVHWVTSLLGTTPCGIWLYHFSTVYQVGQCLHIVFIHLNEKKMGLGY